MKYPYALVSDLHAHSWSQFGSTGPDGVNTRLMNILDELERAGAEVQAAGGDTIVIAGDLFHVRGSIAPEVFNPVAGYIKALRKRGIKFIAIPGNHDLAGKETTELGNAFQSLAIKDLFEIATAPRHLYDFALVPWQSTNDKLHAAIKEIIDTSGLRDYDLAKMDLIIHAGIDGVLSNMPDHGLPAAALSAYGFRRVFAGHYHHHKDFGNGVISIGASTHQTWSDVGTKAGFCLVYEDRVQWFASHAPSFVDFDDTTDLDDVPLIVAGNYVRVRGMKLSNSEIKALEGELKDMGALGVSFQVARETASTRSSTGVPAPAMSLEASIAKYIAAQHADPVFGEKIYETCGEILSAVTSVA